MEFQSTNKLSKVEQDKILSKLPGVIISLLVQYEGKVFLAGGCLRAILNEEEVKDYDLFGSKDIFEKLHKQLKDSFDVKNTTETINANTYHFEGQPPVQLITRWEYNNADEVIKSFDFTISQGVLFHSGGEFRTVTSPTFREDVREKRLVYLKPERNEEFAGSMQRLMKFVKKGYYVNNDNLAKVIARLCKDIGKDKEKSITPPTHFVNGLYIDYDNTMERDEYNSMTEYQLYDKVAKRLDRAQGSKY